MLRLLVLGILLPSFLSAQEHRLAVDIFGGFSNYQGDLQSKYFTTNQSRGAFGIGLHYDLTDHFAIRSNLTLGRIAAADKHSKDTLLQQRNLSFESNITEGNLLLDYNILSLQYHKFTPYVFGGIALFHFRPYAYDTAGRKTFLKPLSTEGEGVAGYNRKEYKLTQFALPFGGGIRWRVADNVILSYEIGFRKTFTDYLDDVSTTYIDQAALAAAKGAKAVEMAYRGGEIKTGAAYPADGTIRGGSKYKDWYYFSGITVSIGINNGDGSFTGWGKNRGRLSCPKF